MLLAKLSSVSKKVSSIKLVLDADIVLSSQSPSFTHTPGNFIHS
jgi:hypothetical protein